MTTPTAPSETRIDAPPGGGGAGAVDDGRLDDLAQIIRAYNDVTGKLQSSHEALKAEVLRLRRELIAKDEQIQRQKRLSALGEMAAGIAHEVRNPLGAIGLYAAMVRDDIAAAAEHHPCDDLAAASQNIQKIAESVRGVESIVLDVLTFAREMRPRASWHAAGEVLLRAVEAHLPGLEAAGVDVQLPEGDTARLPVWVDPGLVQQALLNLVRNAAEAMTESGEGESERVLEMAVEAREERVVMTLSDTGPGIPSESIDRIFNPFFTTRHTGTGLGLAIVHRIVDAHGGSISVTNRAGGGASFRLTFPNPDRTDAVGVTTDSCG